MYDKEDTNFYSHNIYDDVLEFHTVFWCDAQLWEISNEKRRRTSNQKNSSTTQNKMPRATAMQ